MAELKPCPFCGNVPKIHKSEVELVEPFGIICYSCFIVFIGATEKEVVERWNKRS